MIEDWREKLLFSRGVLLLLKETDLFGPMVERAISDLDSVIEDLR